MPIVHYLAYGSNLHPLRLLQRVRSVKLLGIVRLPERTVIFHKRSVDHSAKCDLVEESALVSAYGALYTFLASERAALDAAEGFGAGYSESYLEVSLQGRSYEPFFYTASSTHIDPDLRPYHWYKALVLAGARYHHFPSVYINKLAAVESISDPDPLRAKKNQALLAQMHQF